MTVHAPNTGWVTMEQGMLPRNTAKHFLDPTLQMEYKFLQSGSYRNTARKQTANVVHDSLHSEKTYENL